VCAPEHRPSALATRPDANTDPPPGSDPFSETTSAAFGSDGNDGEGHEVTDLFPPSEASEAGIWALEQADLFNLLCVPPVARESVLTNDARKTAANYCKRRRAFYIVDPDPAWNEPGDITADNGLNTFNAGVERENAALYFPRVRMADVVLGGAVEDFPPCGAVAGVIARTDDMGGVWKAPAGQDATIIGAQDLTVKLTDGENGPLNALGVNCLRVFPLIGPVVWGARTLDGADMLASEWKYVPVRRLALFLEESLHRGTKWVVFEPNDAPLWAQIRLNIGTFMHNLFRQGAFQGATPREAYLVKCDEETTTQTDVDNGLVNIVIGFAPLKPAEFVIIKIQQLAGQIDA
jgi:phage tail sheath protein FI